MSNVEWQDIDHIFKKKQRKSISNALVLTGGGAVQAYFAMGACGCLHQNDMLNIDSYDVISCVSGGSLMAVCLELCFVHRYDLEDDWFNRYVRERGMYALVKAHIASTLIVNMGDITKTAAILVDKIPIWNTQVEEAEFGRGPIFEYNYIDVQKAVLSTDHVDIVNFKTGERKPNWLFTRLMRCCLPLLITNDKLTADAGLGANIPVSTLFDKYKIIDNIDIIKINPRYVRKDYPIPQNKDILSVNTLQALTMNTAADSIVSLVDILYEGITSTVVSASSSFDESKDIYHNGMFIERVTDMPLIQSFLQGILYTDLNQIKILENEGYIQMYHELKKQDRLKDGFVFKVPNPEVYNEDTKKIFQQTLSVNPGIQLVSDIFNTCIV